MAQVAKAQHALDKCKEELETLKSRLAMSKQVEANRMSKLREKE